MRMRSLLAIFLFSLSLPALPFVSFSAPPELPDATPEKLPRWRGFNLLEKFYKSEEPKPFLEEDFKLISGLGFNFVRLPMDYRCWIKGGDWRSFDEKTLSEINQAVEWGRKYGVHVSINFHRAPGYTVAKPPEPKSIWTDPEALEVCALHWGVFAKRYKGIPNRNLSFNLMNEPPKIDGAVYFKVVSALVEAIRKEDPERLVIADGLDWGCKPCPELLPLKVAQATRGYTPISVSHYKAGWMGPSAMTMSIPEWPANMLGNHLYGTQKPDLKSPLTISFPKPLAYPLDLYIEVGVVSNSALLRVSADGRPLFEKLLKCGPGKGEWEKAVYVEEWKIYQNIYNREYKCPPVPAGASSISIENAEGDWMTISKLRFEWEAPGEGRKSASLIPGDAAYGSRQENPVLFNPAGAPFFDCKGRKDAAWLWKNCVEPWLGLQGRGCGVFVGEFGSYNKTPHDVALSWLKDSLGNWKRAGWGWALWNFRGSFGVLDSERADVKYEDFHGHKLDRAMLELLQSN